MHGVFSLVDPQSAPHPPLLPLSQIWAYTETDSMPGLPMNSLNSIGRPLSAPGVMGCFRSLGKPVEARGRFISPLQGMQWGNGGWRGGSTGLKSSSWQVPRGLKRECVAPLGGGHQAHRSRRQRNKQQVSLGLRGPSGVGVAMGLGGRSHLPICRGPSSRKHLCSCAHSFTGNSVPPPLPCAGLHLLIL